MGAAESLLKQAGEWILNKLKDPTTYLDLFGLAVGKIPGLENSGLSDVIKGIVHTFHQLPKNPTNEELMEIRRMTQTTLSAATVVADAARRQYCELRGRGYTYEQAIHIAESGIRASALYRSDPAAYERLFRTMFAHAPVTPTTSCSLQSKARSTHVDRSNPHVFGRPMGV